MIKTMEKNEILINTDKGLIEIPETYYWTKNNKNILKKDAILQLQRTLKFKFEEPDIKEDFRDKPFSTVVVGLKTEEGKVVYGVGSGNYMNLFGFSIDIPTDMAYKRAKSNAAVEYLSSLCEDIDSIFYTDEEKDSKIHNNMVSATKDLVFNVDDKEIIITPNEYYLIEVFDEFSQSTKQMNIFKKSGILKIQKELNLEFGKPIIKETINYVKSSNGMHVPKQFVTIKTPLITEEGIFGYGVGTASPNNLDKAIGIKFAPEMAYKRSKANIVIEYLKYASQTDLPLYSESDYFSDNKNTNTNTNSNTKFNTTNTTNNITTSSNKTKSSTVTNTVNTTIINNNEIIEETRINEKSMNDIFSSFKNVLDKESKKENPSFSNYGNSNNGITASYHFDNNNPKRESSNQIVKEDLGKKELRGIAKYSEGITVEDLVKKDKKMIENLNKRFGNLQEKDIVDESSRKWFDILSDIKQYFISQNMTIEEYLK